MFVKSGMIDKNNKVMYKDANDKDLDYLVEY